MTGTLSQEIAGTWVPDSEVHPATNVYGRRFWARGDIEGVFYGQWPTKDGLRPPELYWHFPRSGAKP